MIARIAMVALAVLIVGNSLAQQPGIKRTELQRHDFSVPGRETVQARIEFAPGAAFPRHTHPGEEIIYGKVTGAELGTYVVEKGKPLVVIVK